MDTALQYYKDLKIHTYFIIFPEGAFQRQYNNLLSTEEKKIKN